MSSDPLDRRFASRTAFLLNANARSVSSRTASALAEIVPEGDLFLSHTLQDAERFARAILRRGYSRVMVGGGDGTLVSSMNLFNRLATEHGYRVPHLGLLKLGTGNAVAGMLRAKDPLLDAHHVANGGAYEVKHVDMVRCEDGTLTPFAGLGYDGEILNDYKAQQEAAQGPIARFLSATAIGYLLAIITRSVPRHFRKRGRGDCRPWASRNAGGPSAIRRRHAGRRLARPGRNKPSVGCSVGRARDAHGRRRAILDQRPRAG